MTPRGFTVSGRCTLSPCIGISSGEEKSTTHMSPTFVISIPFQFRSKTLKLNEETSRRLKILETCSLPNNRRKQEWLKIAVIRHTLGPRRIREGNNRWSLTACSSSTMELAIRDCREHRRSEFAALWMEFPQFVAESSEFLPHPLSGSRLNGRRQARIRYLSRGRPT